MPKSLTIDMLKNASLNVDQTDINEQIKRLSEKLQKNPVLKVPAEYKNIIKDFTDSIIKLNETETKLKETLSIVFPHIDADKFIKLYIRGPVYAGILDVQFYDKLFDMIIERYKSHYSELNSTINVVQPKKDEENNNFVIIPPQTLKVLLTQLTGIIINILISLAVATATSNTEEIKDYVDKQQEETIIQFHSLINEYFTDIKELSDKQDIDVSEIQVQINELMERQEDILETLNKEKE